MEKIWKKYIIGFMDKNQNLIGYDCSVMLTELLFLKSKAFLFELNDPKSSISDLYDKKLYQEMINLGIEFLYLYEVLPCKNKSDGGVIYIKNIKIIDISLKFRFNKFKSNLGVLEFMEVK